MQARNIEQKRRWCQEIKKLIIENFHKSIPDRAKEVVLGRDSDNEKGRLRTGELLTCLLPRHSFLLCSSMQVRLTPSVMWCLSVWVWIMSK